MFGDQVWRLRRRLGWSQSELGARCQISASAIGMMEQGRRLPSPACYGRMATVFRREGYRLPPRPHKPTPRHELLELLRAEDADDGNTECSG